MCVCIHVTLGPFIAHATHVHVSVCTSSHLHTFTTDCVLTGWHTHVRTHVLSNTHEPISLYPDTRMFVSIGCWQPLSELHHSLSIYHRKPICMIWLPT